MNATLATELVQIHSPEWHAQRRLGIGGSEVGDVFNVGYGCARKLWYDKTGAPPDFPRTEAQERILRRGTRMEELVAGEYSDLTGRKVRRHGTRVSKRFPIMRVNIDRQIVNDKRGPGVLEVKTASPWVFDDFEENGLPEQYALQLQHSLIVTEYAWGAFAVMNMATFQMLTFERDLNQELAPLIVQKEADFWTEHVEASVAPQPLPKANDKRCVTCQWRKTCRGQVTIIPDPEDKGYVVDDSLAELAADYIQLLNRKTAVDSAIENCKQEIQAAVGERERVVIPSIAKRIRYAWQRGKRGWDSRGLEGLLANVQKKAAGNPELEQVLFTLTNCQKVGQPSRPFFFEEAGE